MRSKNKAYIMLGIGVLILFSVTSAGATITKSLSVGSRGGEVRELQQKLFSIGLLSESNITGYFGKNTTQALKSLQSQNGLTQTGSTGPKTRQILNKNQSQNNTENSNKMETPKIRGNYTELVSPSGFLNTNGQSIQIGDYVGKKVILVSFITYSCINCQRTIPYMNDWYSRYKDQGLVVIGIHAPEFAYEKNIKNVQKELVEKQGVKFPVVLDNDFKTWNAYGNQFWPHRYIIDLDGNVVYDHIGEGAYSETENKIKTLLKSL